MHTHIYLDNPALSLSKGKPLSQEEGLGALTLGGFLQENCERYADREALLQPLANGDTLRWTYRDLFAHSCEIAKALMAHGLGKGERVGILMTNRAEFLASVFGTALAGGVATTISTFSTPSELEYFLQISACSVLLMEPQVLKKDFAAMLMELEPLYKQQHDTLPSSSRFPYLQKVIQIGGGVAGAFQSWDSFRTSGTPISNELLYARSAAVSPADTGVLFFSSGSTNKPKGILSSHRGVSVQMWRMGEQQKLDDGVRTWTANGFFWSGNFSMAVGATLAKGGCLLLQSTFQPAEAITLMEREKATFLFAWPHQWAQLMDASNWESSDLSSMRHVDIESPLARQPTITTDWIEPRHCYGNTETFTLSTGHPANTPRSIGGDSHGFPFPGMTIKIVDPLINEILPLGERGEIAVKGPTLMMGYLGIPLEDSLDAEGFFRTGDGGYLDAQGQLFWEGRLNDIIKTGGANVSPLEIDDVLRTHEAVKIVQTIGLPDDLLGEIVVSCVVPHDSSLLSEATLQAFAKEKLASYKVPRRILFCAQEDLEMTGSAKIKTADLRTLASKIIANTELQQSGH